MMTQHDMMERERKLWEEEAKREVIASERGESYAVSNSASAMNGMSAMPLVKSQWDSILT